MNLDIFKMDIKRMRKHLLIAILSPVAYSSLIMVFYIGFADVFEDMQGLFESSSLQSLLRAFSMDSNSFTYILNYYVSYNGVYMLLMGIIFAATLSVRLFSKELKEGTYEFMYANPVSRVKVFMSKSMVVVFYLFIMNLIVFLIGLGSLELLKTKSPILSWMSESNIEMLENKVEESPDRMAFFNLDDELFYDVIYSNFQDMYTMTSNAENLDGEVVSDLMNVFLMNPEGIFDEMLNNKEKYMVLFNMTPGEEEAFEKIILAQKESYFTIKDQFKNEPSISLNLFKSNPEPFINQVVKDNRIEAFVETFDLTDDQREGLFVYYSLDNYIELSIVTFLVMLSIAMFVMMIVIIVPKGNMTSGMASGICFAIYLMNMMANIAEPVRFLRYFTPLSYINTNVMDVNYSTESWSLIVMMLMIVISYAVSIMSINKKDLIT